MNRPIINDTEILLEALYQIKDNTDRRLEEKGYGAFVSSHEILGIISEEYDEMKEAIHENNINKLEKELEDIATACHFALACIKRGILDW